MTRLAISLLIAVGVGVILISLELIVRRRRPRSDETQWIVGGLYFNRADPRLLVPKRFGIGRTLNLGHPVSWLLIALPIAVALIARLH